MASPSKVNLGPTLGVGYVGVSISSIIYGVASLQTFQYYMSSKAKTDSKGLHLLVGLLWYRLSLCILLIPFTAQLERTGSWEPFEMFTFYFYLITHNADLLQTLLSNPWSMASSIIITAAFAIAHFVVAVDSFTLMLTSLTQVAQSLGIGSAALGASTDGLIMLVMAFFLLRSQGVSRHTHNLIYTLLTYTVTTGALCACCSLASVITYVVVPNAFYNYIFNVLGAELYINVFLTSLNVREAVRRGLDNWTSNTIPLSDITFKSGSDVASRSQERPNGSHTVIEGSSQASVEMPTNLS
ncbi:hypothetical protein V8D89_000139 [Ganoderma adspersum]